MMIRQLLSLYLAFQLICGTAPVQSARATLAMKSGVLLRMHVIAQDDTPEMQRIKLCVRDAVRQVYADAPKASGTSMLASARELLPQLTHAARLAARKEGYPGNVAVTIERTDFDRRTLDGLTIPAGEYPALIIRLGSAQGHNWWGLIAPELALNCARLPEDGWDWSFRGFLRALFGLKGEVTCHE